MLVYEVIGIIRVFYEEENDLIIHEWLRYNPEDSDRVILEILQKLYELFLTYPVSKVLVKTELAKGAFSPAIQDYVRSVQFPRILNDTQLQYVATVKSSDLFEQICTDIWEDPLKQGSSLLLHDVHNEAEARAWFKSIETTRASSATARHALGRA